MEALSETALPFLLRRRDSSGAVEAAAYFFWSWALRNAPRMSPSEAPAPESAKSYCAIGVTSTDARRSRISLKPR